MPKITEHTRVIDGFVHGYVRTDNQGSECEFMITDVKHWESLSDDDAEELAKEALHESGIMEWGY